MMRIWSQRVKPGDVIVDKGEEREVKRVRVDWRSGTMAVELTFQSGPAMQLGASDSVYLSDSAQSSLQGTAG